MPVNVHPDWADTMVAKATMPAKRPKNFVFFVILVTFACESEYELRPVDTKMLLVSSRCAL